MDEFAKQLGFKSAKEMNRLISSVDISTPEKMKAFLLWKEEDGTKEGLLKLIETTEK